MNKAFGDFRDRLVSTGLTEGQLDDISEIATQFVGFMQTVRRPGETKYGEEVAPVPPVEEIGRPVDQSQEQLSLVPNAKNVASWMDQAALGHEGRRNQRPDIGMGYTMYMPNVFDELVDNFNVPAMAQSIKQPTAKSPVANPFDNTGINVFTQPTISLDSELAAPKTYSFQETTLARRLHRACLESAYHLLLDPGRRPHTYERVFKLSLLSRDRTRMAANIKRILNRGLDEPLDLWEAPLLHIGGCGTHYPRREPTGQPLPARKQVCHLGMIGPQMLNLLENVVQARPAVDISVEIAGFEGEWFDPYDIEGYLAAKGIHIDPTMSFVEAEVTETPEDGSRVSADSSTRTSTVPGSRTSTSPWDHEQRSELREFEADLNRWDEVGNVQVSGLSNVGYSDAMTGSWMNFQQVDQTGGKDTSMNMPFSQAETSVLGPNLGDLGQISAPWPEPQKKVVIIDVAKFVKGEHTPVLMAQRSYPANHICEVLTVTGVCLGRTPGFKRKDVDRALAISSFDAF